MPSNYTLADVEQTHREFPRTFSIPRSELRHALQPGWLVKLVFTLPEPVDNYDAERMWVEVTGRRDGHYVGRLDNAPYFVKDLHTNDEVLFEPKHVAALQSLDEDRQLPALVGVGVDVLRSDAWPQWIVKVEPTHRHDSGWRVFSAAEAERGATVRAISTSTLFRSWSVTDSAIDAGWDGVWRWDADAFEYVRAGTLPAPLAAPANAGLGRVHRPTPDPNMGAVVTRRALEELAPITAQRLPPSKTHAEDSGWCVYVGDESQEYLDDPENSTVVPLARLLHDYPYVERVLGETKLATWTWDDALADWKLVKGSARPPRSARAKPRPGTKPSRHAKPKPKRVAKAKAKAQARATKGKPAAKAKPRAAANAPARTKRAKSPGTKARAKAR